MMHGNTKLKNNSVFVFVQCYPTKSKNMFKYRMVSKTLSNSTQLNQVTTDYSY